MASRKDTSERVETSILMKSRRRCCLCFHLDEDAREKLGQIAHIDHDPSNSTEENLAYLCFDHHSKYDSTTKQHKNYTPGEVKAARSALYQYMESSANSKTKFYLIIEGPFAEFDDAKKRAAATELRGRSKDPGLTIVAVAASSVELEIESSDLAYRTIKKEVESGELAELAGRRILRVAAARQGSGTGLQSNREYLFQSLHPTITGNPNLRIPQREAYDKIKEHFELHSDMREVGVVLPVGCGKSGLIAITPFAVNSRRALVVAPGIRIAAQLLLDFDPGNPEMFYQKCKILDGPWYPEPAEIRSSSTNRGDLDEADVVITNIQQLQGSDNRWLSDLPTDFFDLILVDEGHHNVAASWEIVRSHFPSARIVNFSATPTRADGQLMTGKIIYSFPIFRAIEAGYVKRLKAIMLNPATLRYVRKESGEEIEVGLDEVKRLGEDDSDFRRSIVSSQQTLETIVDASIRELRKLRSATSDGRHKIITSALNYAHCIQIVEAYRSKGLRADYIHSKEDSATNDRILERLRNHELDVIVQVRMLGEGFDHPYLSVAAVCSIFSNLSPFAQFVGRIMRVIKQNDPQSPLNQGAVVFHAGANVARVWSDFQQFSEADQKFYDALLPVEHLNFNEAVEVVEDLQPLSPREIVYEVKEQGQVALEEIDLLKSDQRAKEAFEYLRRVGFTSDNFREAELLHPVPITKQRKRQAGRKALDDRIKNSAGRALHARGLNPEGHDLDRKYLGRTNWVLLKAAVDRKCNEFVGRGLKERSEFTQEQIDRIIGSLDSLVEEAVSEVINAKA